MEIRFNKTGAERKALVAAISEITGMKAQYLGAPGFAFKVDGYIIGKDGTLETGAASKDEIISLLTALAEGGFVPVDTPDFNFEDSIVPDAGEEAKAPDLVSVAVPFDGFTDTAFSNLEKLVAGKAMLIRKALGDDLAADAEALPLIRENDRVCFPWFYFDIAAENLAAWARFTSALCAATKKQKRVILKEKPLDDGASEKFAMRCFLLKLGFIGDEYKQARKIILAGLPGDGSHKMPKPEEPQAETAL